MSELWASLITIPERADLRGRTYSRLNGAHRVLVFEDLNHHGVWPNTRRAWWYDYPPEVSHVMTLQDDAFLCKDFIQTVWRLIWKWPDNIIVPFSAWTPQRVNGTVWRSYNKYGGVCLVYPIKVLKAMREWVDKHVVPSYPHDDRRVAVWAQLHKHKCVLPRYSLAMHDVSVQSAVGHRSDVEGRYFIGQDMSGLTVDWYEGNPPTESHSDELKAILPYLKGDYRVV